MKDAGIIGDLRTFAGCWVAKVLSKPDRYRILEAGQDGTGDERQLMTIRAITGGILALVIGWNAMPFASAQAPFILLGPADEIALDQPRVAVELIDPTTGRSLGPSFANTFLLDTGANSILAVDDAIYELNLNGYRTEGTFLEQGIGGFTQFDVSAVYDVRFAGADGQVQTIPDARLMSSTTTSFCPIPGFCSFFGIIGMPAMENRVTTLNLSSLAGGGTLPTIDDIFNGSFDVGFLETTFSSSVPATDLRQYHVPLSAVSFPAEGDGPLPSWSDLPFINVTTAHEGAKQRGNFVLDTGAQLSLMSSSMAFGLGLDTNGNGSLNDEAVSFQAIGGVGGTINAPVMYFEELRLPTDEGVELTFNNVQVAIADIHPSIDGVFGMNFLSSGWTSLVFGGLGDLSDLLNDAGLGDLFGDLGGSDLLGLGSPYGYFEKAHFDFRNWDAGEGRMVLDLMPEVAGPMAFDGTHGDLDLDGDVDLDDRTIWVHDVLGSKYGDSNLDGSFDSLDVIAVLAANTRTTSPSTPAGTRATGTWTVISAATT